MQFHVHPDVHDRGTWVATCDAMPDMRVKADSPVEAISLAVSMIERETGRPLDRTRLLSYGRSAALPVLDVDSDPAATLGRVIIRIIVVMGVLTLLTVLLLALAALSR